MKLVFISTIMSAPVVRFFVFFLIFNINKAFCDLVSVKISAQEHVNVVSDKFLSFTVDPRFLFANNGGSVGEDCLCMAAALSPAYIRIAGPSSAQMDFLNSTLLINTTDNEVTSSSRLAVDAKSWRRFAEWARANRFELVFALNGEGKTGAGRWDPNTALSILSVAEEAGIEEIVWQLGYECRNSSAEEYLEELETLRVMVATFPAGRTGGWRVIAGDVTPCLSADSKASFRDYVRATDEALDAVFLNGNSSAAQLEKLKDSERLSLLELLSNSSTPLWITESRDEYSELERAVDWLTSLGYSARSGFDVNFRELTQNELYEPTLSFYMSLLFKNLVGNRVLEVEIQEDSNGPEKSPLFAHCTTLKHQAVPGAITLFGANMDEQAVRFAIKLSKREEGGDIMQFVLSQDRYGNTLVNGHPMFYEGDIKPVVKRVRPYKTLLITLPPKSFGFWVLANTKIEACHKPNENDHNLEFIPATPVEDIGEKMTFAHKGYQNRKRRETSSLRNDVILHKWIEDNKIPKEKFTIKNWKEIVETDFLDLRRALAELQNEGRINRFLDTLVPQKKIKYESENDNEIEMQYLSRQKRQTLGEKLKAAVTKLKTNSNKFDEVNPKIASTDLNLPLKLTKFNKENENTGLKYRTDPKEMFKEKDNSGKKENFKENESSVKLMKTYTPRGLLEDSKARIQELRRRLHAKRGKTINKITHVKPALRLTKINTADKKVDGIINRIKKTEKRSNDLVDRKDDFKLKGEQSNLLTSLNPALSHGRTKRSTTKLTNSRNSIVIDSKKQFENQNSENSDIFVKNFLNKTSEKLDARPVTEIKESYNSENDGEKTKVITELLSNEIPKKPFDAQKSKSFEDQILFKTKISDEDAFISIDEKSNQHGLLKNTFESVTSFVDDLRENFARIWAILPNFP